MSDNFRDGYSWLATAIARPGFVVQIYLNGNTGEWRLLGIDNDMGACQMLEGFEWTFVLVQGI